MKLRGDSQESFGKPLRIWQRPLAQLVFGLKAQSYYDPPTMTGDQGVRHLMLLFTEQCSCQTDALQNFPPAPPSFEIGDISETMMA